MAEQSRKRNSSRIVIIFIAVIALTIVVGIAAYSNSPSMKLNKQLALGERYLNELSYEQAVTAFKAALDIEPNSEEAKQGLTGAYSKWATSLVDASEYEKTIAVLDEAISVLPESETLIEQRVETYLSWAEYYANSSDYENAIKVAKEGYDVTGDSRFLDVQKKYEKLQQIEAQNKEKSDYLASKKAIFDKMFSMIEAGDYVGACDYSNTEEMHSVFSDPFPGELIYDENGLNAELSGKGYGVYRKDDEWFLFYFGDYLNGVIDGTGMMFTSRYYPESPFCYVYDGEWADNKPNGEGVEIREWPYEQDNNRPKKIVYYGSYLDGFENGAMREELYLVSGKQPIFHYTSEMGIREDITSTVNFGSLRENQYVYAVEDSNNNYYAVEQYGKIRGVFEFTDW